MSTQYYIYILTNASRTVLYTGITKDVIKRTYQHKQGVIQGFTQKYKVHDLLYYEIYNTPIEAIEREKQIKSWSRKKKFDLVSSMNPSLRDLYPEIVK